MLRLYSTCIPRVITLTILGTKFTAVEQESLWHRFVWQIRRCRAWLKGDTLSPFFRHERNGSLPDLGYLLLEFILEGDLLFSSWQQYRQDEVRRNNLYRGFPRILLDLAKVPLPRIGSWRMDGRGVISLTNRPLLDLTMPDLHKSNMFVDDDWNIVNVIDFEFAPVQPQEMVNVPHWLSDKSIDELVGPDLDEYKGLHDLFIDILEEEEAARKQDHVLSKRLRGDWQTGRLWYNEALRSSNGFPIVFQQNIQPRFFANFERNVEGLTLTRLYSEDCEELIAAKLHDKAQYDERIHAIFAESRQLQSSKD